MGGGGRREWAVRGRHFHVAFVEGGGENIVVARSKRKWRVCYFAFCFRFVDYATCLGNVSIR